MANSLWVDTVRSGPLADRPTTPDVPENTFVFWYDETNNVLYAWLESDWVNVATLLAAQTQASLQLTPTAFASLPADGAGKIAYVNDLADNTVGATAAGGGALSGFVANDGTDWIVGGAAAPA